VEELEINNSNEDLHSCCYSGMLPLLAAGFPLFQIREQLDRSAALYINILNTMLSAFFILLQFVNAAFLLLSSDKSYSFL
jgi:hypothetical protein